MTTELITNETIFITDWSSGDKRSVKAYLAGTGDRRVLWWKLNYAMHWLLSPKASMEEAMHSFHCRHHALTRFAWIFQRDAELISEIMISQGAVAGVRRAVALLAKESSPR